MAHLLPNKDAQHPIFREIQAFLIKHNMKITVFGREAVRDPRLVQDIQWGRQPRPETIARIKAYMKNYQKASKA